MADINVYEVTAVLYFEQQDEAVDFVHDCRIALAKATLINAEHANKQVSTVTLVDCRHTESPPEPCTELERFTNDIPA